jgi:outer membrane biosynthesis protein TonB
MRIDRYVHDERLTWGAAGVLAIVTALHLAGIGRLLVSKPPAYAAPEASPIFQVSLQKLPPPPPRATVPRPADAPPQSDAVRNRPQQTRPVPILVDTPTTDPVPPDTQVKKYEIGDELLPGVPGPPMPEGVEGTDEPLYADAAPVEETPVYWKLKLVDMRPPVYPPRCLRMGIEGRVKVRRRRSRWASRAASPRSTRPRWTPCASGASSPRSATACRCAPGRSCPWNSS